MTRSDSAAITRLSLRHVRVLDVCFAAKPLSFGDRVRAVVLDRLTRTGSSIEIILLELVGPGSIQLLRIRCHVVSAGARQGGK
jgi:hypothetical protein